MEKLTRNFINELFKACLRNKEVFAIVQQHLEYTHLPSEAYKKIWRGIVEKFEVEKTIPTVGQLSQLYATDPEVLSALNAIKKATIVKRTALIKQFDTYIRASYFVDLYDKIGELWEQNKRDEALKVLTNTTERLDAFSLEAKQYTRIFEDFNQRHLARQESRILGEDLRKKIPTGIDAIDHLTHGGLDRKDTLLFAAQSGAGKTKFLRWLGTRAANLGATVIHIQGEGSKEECESGYDATWIGMSMLDVRRGQIPDVVAKKLDSRVNNVLIAGGEIYIEAFEQFGRASMGDIRQMCQVLERQVGKIDLIIMDYLEKFQPSSRHSYKPDHERQRRERVAEEFKDLCVEFGATGATATQASNVAPLLLNNPDFVMTRDNISEFKGLLQSFSFFFTFNQTVDEYNNKFARLYVDKMRNYRAKQVIPIFQDYANEQFYDGVRTRNILMGADGQITDLYDYHKTKKRDRKKA